MRMLSPEEYNLRKMRRIQGDITLLRNGFPGHVWVHLGKQRGNLQRVKRATANNRLHATVTLALSTMGASCVRLFAPGHQLLAQAPSTPRGRSQKITSGSRHTYAKGAEALLPLCLCEKSKLYRDTLEHPQGHAPAQP